MKKFFVTIYLTVWIVMMACVAVHAAEVTGNTWIMPVSNYTSIGCRFGCNCSVHGGKHPGNDIRADKNTMVLAIHSGTVEAYRNNCKGSHWSTLKECSCGKMSGNYVKIKHTNGSFSVYYHMNKVCVKTGDQVEQGDIIGYIGRTGNASGYHTCFEYHNANDKATSFSDTIIDNNKAANGATKYLMSYRKADKSIGLYEKPSTSSAKVMNVPKDAELLCRIIQENYGFTEYDGVQGWVYLPNTTKLKAAFQVDYYKNGGKGMMSNTTHVAGDDIVLPSNKFTKSGYIFSGWELYKPYNNTWFYMSPDKTEYGWYVSGEQPSNWKRKRFSDNEVVPGLYFENTAGRQVLRMTAKWVSADATAYTIKFNSESGNGTMEDMVCTGGVQEKLPACNFAAEGLVFSGWMVKRASDQKWLYKNAEGTSTWSDLNEQPEGYFLRKYADRDSIRFSLLEDGEILYFCAQWSLDGHIWLNPQNGEERQAKSVEAESFVGTLPIPQMPGYHFLGWYTEPEGGEKITSLSGVQELNGTDTLYAHWLSHDERPQTEAYIEKTWTGNQYTLALSHLLVAAGQQKDDFTAEQCYTYLDAVDMISEAGNVWNGRFVSSGFLELYASELTWEDKFIGTDYDHYVAHLSDLQNSGYYIMVKLDIDGTNTQWVYLYEADGENLFVVYNGGVVNVTDVAVGIISTNLFFYHGTERVLKSGNNGTYEIIESVDTRSINVSLNYAASSLQSGTENKVWIAFYSEDGRFLYCKQKTEAFDENMHANMQIAFAEEFEECMVFVMNNDMKPQCEGITLANIDE